MFDGGQLNIEPFDVRVARAARFLNRGGVLALTLRLRDRVARGILLTLQFFNFFNGAAAQTVERRDLLERLVGINAAISQARPHQFNVLAHKPWVEHRSTIVSSRRYPTSVTIFRCEPPYARPCSPP